MDRQAFFNKTARHLLTQMRKAEGVVPPEGNPRMGTSCLYRSPDGLSCAVGCHIKDEFYNPRIEGFGVFTEQVRGVLDASGVDTEKISIGFMEQLQEIHDTYSPMDWKEQLETFAKDHGLKFEI